MGAIIESDEAVGTPDLSRLCRFLSELSPQPMVAVEGRRMLCCISTLPSPVL